MKGKREIPASLMSVLVGLVGSLGQVFSKPFERKR